MSARAGMPGISQHYVIRCTLLCSPYPSPPLLAHADPATGTFAMDFGFTGAEAKWFNRWETMSGSPAFAPSAALYLRHYCLLRCCSRLQMLPLCGGG